MDSEGSITLLIDKIVRQGDEYAAQLVFDRYFVQLVQVAANRLGGVPRGAEDEEDAAISALDSFIQRARNNEFPELKDRHNLWLLLLKITERKAINLLKRQLALKRGNGKVLGEGVLRSAGDDSDQMGLAAIQGPIPTPEFIAELKEQYRIQLKKLKSEELRTVARLRLQAYTCKEIAVQLGVVERTVERKLRLIRDLWEDEES
jgi:DNA-directed RNA polymerase specialized sigma24 family protein